jgi:DNA-binding CsgD family transcriptional regulator
MFHRRNLYKKLQSTTRARAMAAARSIGLIN